MRDFQASFQSEVFVDLRKTECDLLHSSSRLHGKCEFTFKEHPGSLHHGTWCGSISSEFKNNDIETVYDIDVVFIVEISIGMFEHEVEDYTEKS